MLKLFSILIYMLIFKMLIKHINFIFLFFNGILDEQEVREKVLKIIVKQI